MRSTCKNVTKTALKGCPTDNVMKAKELLTAAHRYMYAILWERRRWFLLQFGYCRGALVQYGEGRSLMMTDGKATGK